MVAASHSSFTNTVKKEELAQAECEHIKAFSFKRVESALFLSEWSRHLVCSCQSLERKGHKLIQSFAYYIIYMKRIFWICDVQMLKMKSAFFTDQWSTEALTQYSRYQLTTAGPSH